MTDLLEMVGRSYGCHFRIDQATHVNGELVFLLTMRGQRYVISADELRALVERGFVAEEEP